MHSKKYKAFISIFAIFFSAIIASVLIGVFVLLIRQIQLLTLDSSSFQAFYTADSAAECAIAKERVAAQKAFQISASSGIPTFIWDTTLFSPNNWIELKDEGCAVPGDIELSIPTKQGDVWITDAKLLLTANNADFCGIIRVVRNTKESNTPNTISASGRSTSCDSTANDRVVEREILINY